MISIIIPVFNQHEMTKECLDAIRENTQNYQIILVDNGSDPPIPIDDFQNGYSTPYGDIFPGDIVIRNETNLGFPVAINQGIRASKGDVICVLNNDVIVTPGWTDRLRSNPQAVALDQGVQQESPEARCR